MKRLAAMMHYLVLKSLVRAGILTDDKEIEVMPVVYEIDKDNAPETVLEVTTPPHTTQPNYRCAKGVLQWNDSELPEDVIGRLRSES